jgi:predicted HTH domain antitoxin
VSEIIIDVPDRSLVALKLKPANAGIEIRMMAAMKLFELGRLSSGAASELAGIPKPLFLSKLSDFGISAIKHNEKELTEDLENACSHLQHLANPVSSPGRTKSRGDLPQVDKIGSLDW